MLLFVAGLGAWTLLEYVIHGVLSHQFETVVGRLHSVHHKDAHAVFTARAWLPLAIITTAGLMLFGLNGAMVWYLGLVSGFVAYEVVHYRIHFTRPRNRLETRLRRRHLAHHVGSPGMIFGVTSPLWDWILGTEPAPERLRHLETVAERVPVLTGSSNWKRMVTIWQQAFLKVVATR